MTGQSETLAAHQDAGDRDFQQALTATLFASPVSLAIGAAAGSAGGLSAAFATADPLTRYVGLAVPAVGLLRVAHATYIGLRAVTSLGTRTYEAGAWLFSLLLGVLAFLSLTRTDHAGLHLLTCCLAIGYSAGICARNAGRPKVALGQLTLAAVPISPALLLSDDPVKWVLAVVNIFFVLGLADITVKIHRIFRSAVARARASEEEHRAAISHLPVMSWTARSDGQSIYQSPQWEAFTGTTDIGSAYTNVGIVHQEDWAALDATWRRSVKTGSDFRARYRLLHRSGKYRTVLSAAQPERDDAGKIVRWHGVCIDVDATIPV